MKTAKTCELDAKSFHVLLVLAREPLHGYAVRQAVEDESAGRVRLWPASLYGTLSGLADDGLIAETDSPRGTDDDARRRYYRITAVGREALASEAQRLESLTRLALSRVSARGEGKG